MRNGNGTFAAGNPGGPGRPKRDVEQEYLNATVGAVPIDDWIAIVSKAVEQAKSGDAKARDWLSNVLGIDGTLKFCQVDEEGELVAEADVESLAAQQAKQGKQLIAALDVLRSLGLANERNLFGRDVDDVDDDEREEEFAADMN